MSLRALAAILAICLACTSGWALSESEFNNDPSNANGPVIFPGEITGNLLDDGGGVFGPSDFFYFDAVAGRTYTFSGYVVGGSFIWPIYLGVGIWNSSTLLDYRQATGGNQPASITWTAPSSGRFYLQVFDDVESISGSYSINCSFTSDVNDWALY